LQTRRSPYTKFVGTNIVPKFDHEGHCLDNRDGTNKTLKLDLRRRAQLEEQVAG